MIKIRTFMVFVISSLLLFSLCSCSKSSKLSITTTGGTESKVSSVTKTYDFTKYEDKFENMYDCSFMLDDKPYILPCSVTNFTKLGYKFSDKDNKIKLSHNYYQTVTLANENNDKLSLTLYNDDYIPKELSELTVYGVVISDSKNQKLNNDISTSLTLSNLCEKLGKPTGYKYSVKTELLTLNYKNKNYKINFTFKDDKCTKLDYIVNFS